MPVLGVLMAHRRRDHLGVCAGVQDVQVSDIEPELHRKRGRATGIHLALRRGGGRARRADPVPRAHSAVTGSRADATGDLFAREPGFVDHVRRPFDGQRLKKGEVILVCHDPRD